MDYTTWVCANYYYYYDVVEHTEKIRTPVHNVAFIH